MEGLIPYVYRMIVQYRSGGVKAPNVVSLWFNESPSASPSMAYMRLPGDSGRYIASDIQFFSPSSLSAPATTSSIQSPFRHSTSCKRS
ncbi:hypothetical protein IHE45_07G131900 [Dioscorea alata]|uniref:Uncharacterized protein n=1 Tax=Dioscorea alata TaxID=55571 RepID=A0ACB7VUN8_DIOAL|nr:hypothetical protein IHE45_07G131900 [Dioscorea alata]